MNATTYLERVARALRVARYAARRAEDRCIRARSLGLGSRPLRGRLAHGARLEPEIQVDLLPRLYGVRASFESLRARSMRVRVGAEVVRVGSLEDVIKSKRAAARKKDLAMLPILEDTLREKKKQER